MADGSSGETESGEQSEAAGLVESRRSLYAFLSRIFEKEITLDLLKQISESDNPLFQMAELEGSKLDDAEEKEFTEGFAELVAYLKENSERDPKELKRELDIEYASLFLGTLGKLPHPSESAYSTDEHLMMQRARDEVLSSYRKTGFQKSPEFTEPEDHIAVELQFMALLCERTTEALRTDDKEGVRKYLTMQREFVAKHLGTWVPRLTKDILKSGKVGFYRGTAKILDGLVKVDLQNIDFLHDHLTR